MTGPPCTVVTAWVRVRRWQAGVGSVVRVHFLACLRHLPALAVASGRGATTITITITVAGKVVVGAVQVVVMCLPLPSRSPAAVAVAAAAAVVLVALLLVLPFPRVSLPCPPHRHRQGVCGCVICTELLSAGRVVVVGVVEVAHRSPFPSSSLVHSPNSACSLYNMLSVLLLGPEGGRVV